MVTPWYSAVFFRTMACNAGDFAVSHSEVNHDRLLTLLLPHGWIASMLPLGRDGVVGTVDEHADTYRRAVSGDEHAWQELFDRWKKPLLSFFYRSLGSLTEAEDLTLEVFVRLHRAGQRFDGRAAFSTYLFQIARNLLLNELRRRRRKPADPLPPEAFDFMQAPPPEDHRHLAELEESFQRALAELPEAQRTVLLLVHQQHLEIPETATLLGVTPNALRVQLHRARTRLKEILTRLP